LKLYTKLQKKLILFELTMAFSITWEDSGVHVKLYDTLTQQDVLDSDYALYSHPQYDGSLYCIWDTSYVKRMTASIEDASISAAMDSSAARYTHSRKIALIAKLDEIKDFLNVYVKESKKLNQNWEFEIFDDLETARGWLKQRLG
ncbi:MAG: hypothetical protein OQJ89_02350, partial [Kangiellaceae bacterium]|nr:hypothetical protein [Kangiellaceae bacterium]